MKILFLDVDGVLNCPGSFPTIEQSKVALLNQLDETLVVLSSSWRYYVYMGQMNQMGLSALFRSHGLLLPLVGITKSDEEIKGRENQIMEGVQRFRPSAWCAVDDLDLKLQHFVQTDGAEGLTEKNVLRIKEILDGQ